MIKKIKNRLKPLSCLLDINWIQYHVLFLIKKKLLDTSIKINYSFYLKKMQGCNSKLMPLKKTKSSNKNVFTVITKKFTKTVEM